MANEALRQSRFTGNRKRAVASRIRRAQVLQFQGKLDEAASELTHCLLDSEVHEWTRLAAYARQHRGKVHFDQGNFDDALADFTEAVLLRKKDGADADELDSSLLAVAAVEARLANHSAQA